MRRNLNLVARSFYEMRGNFFSITNHIKTERYTRFGNKPRFSMKTPKKFYNLSRRNFAV